MVRYTAQCYRRTLIPTLDDLADAYLSRERLAAGSTTDQLKL